ncbi:DNA polymerase IV [Mechercharimyces sp. CAU 1602]|uniref:DNA polymerase IV n=1 Tax=Mechercharimyces sp. CAU 1602 TaxID=2973933 RepID=UPI002162B4EC|nr:DNA polymerase IV [Mechercharimyces sp. CAU 1602]MCS1350567.1 DNA polymerase IV [Mechercharimyces sp. CAU 1602]
MEDNRTILLADMNAFYASVEQTLHPQYQGKPLIVCGDPQKRRGIVLAASYEAKHYGVKTAMPVHEAKSLCPTAQLVPPHMGTYIQVSTRIIQLLQQFSPSVEPFSIDEAFLELTGSEKLLGKKEHVAHQIKQRIRTELGVSCSIGIGPNKLLAKMAAEMEKPDGLTSITANQVPRKIWPLPINKLFGVGSRMNFHFNKMGIRTIGDLAHTDPTRLEHRFGIIGRVLYQSAHGMDQSPVDPHSLDINHSIGHQFTLPYDYIEAKDILLVLYELAENVARRARLAASLGRTITLALRGNDFSIHRSLSLDEATQIGRMIYQAIEILFQRHWNHRPVRQIGITLSNLQREENGVQLDLFGNNEKYKKLTTAIDSIQQRYGVKSMCYAHSLLEASLFKDHTTKIGGHHI